MTPTNTLQKRMAESAAALFEEDERLSIRLVESDDNIQVQKRQPASQEWQRVLYYFVGGVLALGLLLLLAAQMNPPDSALRGQALTQNLGPWDGLWTGSMTRYSLGGDKIAEFNVRREYSSTDPKVQTADVSRIFSDGTSESDVWVFKVTEEGQLTGNRRSEESGSAPYLGRVAGNQAFWVRHTDQGTEILRSWIHGNLLFVEEEYVPTGNPTAGWIISGQLSRTTHH